MPAVHRVAWRRAASSRAGARAKGIGRVRREGSVDPRRSGVYGDAPKSFGAARSSCPPWFVRCLLGREGRDGAVPSGSIAA
ncbi:MAG: hypothetical protein D6705_16340 [Deltaproteobacteria bacterium]|nr:MAG: hypothetical protein D6705_16340 [Deltaproteobacteria bacterium]